MDEIYIYIKDYLRKCYVSKFIRIHTQIKKKFKKKDFFPDEQAII